MSYEDSYFRVLNYKGEPTVAELQHFDESGYNHDRYLVDHKFETEYEALLVAESLKLSALLLDISPVADSYRDKIVLKAFLDLCREVNYGKET